LGGERRKKEGEVVVEERDGEEQGEDNVPPLSSQRQIRRWMKRGGQGPLGPNRPEIAKRGDNFLPPDSTGAIYSWTAPGTILSGPGHFGRGPVVIKRGPRGRWADGVAPFAHRQGEEGRRKGRAPTVLPPGKETWRQPSKSPGIKRGGSNSRGY